MQKILVVGGGGREHAIAMRLAREGVQLYAAPGNAGIGEIAECVPIKATDVAGVVEFCVGNAIDLCVVSPDDSIALGMVDALTAAGIRAFGPTKAASELEHSKVFSKAFMKRHSIPTAAYEAFDDCAAAKEYLRSCTYPQYIKTDGLALGKGAVFAGNYDEAVAIVEEMMLQKSFGNAGSSVVIEEFMQGDEVTVLAFVDGETVVPMLSSRDHKKALDGDNGLNTGGMGVIAPFPPYTPAIADYCMEHIYLPTVKAIAAEGRPYKGVLYFGLMLDTAAGTARVVEYNSRFGDPEAQTLLTLLSTDLLQVFNAIIDGKLETLTIEWQNKNAATVVLASGGYPLKYETGKVIKGLGDVRDCVIHHAGTATKDGAVVTAGGRVLAITCTGDTLADALDKCYANAQRISFDGMFCRTDIGKTAKG